MPYSGSNDPKLPKNVRKLSSKRKRQWIAVWTSSYRKHGDEGRAFAAANSAVKELSDTDSILLHSVKEFRIAS